MKSLAFIFLNLILLSGSVKAQSVLDYISKPRVEFGLNTTVFVANLLSLNQNTVVNTDPYVLQFKVLKRGTDGLRFGLGGSYRSIAIEQDNSVKQNFIFSSFDVRIGYEHREKVGKKWEFFTGVDLVYSYNSNKINIVNDSHQEFGNVARRHLVGGGPILGFQFFITKRISLGTETTARFLYGDILEQKGEVVAGDLPSGDSSDFVSFNFILPTSIYLNITLR